MSLYGLEKWRPYIDEHGVLRPTNKEMQEMLAKSELELMRALGICGLVAGLLLGLLVCALSK